jgi:hypothetical protein
MNDAVAVISTRHNTKPGHRSHNAEREEQGCRVWRTRGKLSLSVVPGCGACRLVGSRSRDGGAWRHSAHPPRSLRLPRIR